LACKYPFEVKEWEEQSNTIVLLGVPDDDYLLGVADLFDGWCGAKLNAPWVLFYEPDINEHTSIACLLDSKQAKRFSSLPLLLSDYGKGVN
jgi:hypothetical protein